MSSDNKSFIKGHIATLLLEIFARLFAAYGPQHWWPAEGPFEIMVGAILTQSAAWANVEKALRNLKTADALSPAAMRRLTNQKLAMLVRPSGYYNAKARKLKSLSEWFSKTYKEDVSRMSAQKKDILREQLLAVHGVGPETADSIILYVANQPTFVIDAYTRRILERLGLLPEIDKYDSYQALFMDNLPADAKLFNEYHALLVRLGKEVCKKKPDCANCCLKSLCRGYKS